MWTPTVSLFSVTEVPVAFLRGYVSFNMEIFKTKENVKNWIPVFFLGQKFLRPLFPKEIKFLESNQHV